jgi:hypothetical protein
MAKKEKIIGRFVDVYRSRFIFHRITNALELLQIW